MLVEVVREQQRENLEMLGQNYTLVAVAGYVDTKAVDLSMDQQEAEEVALQF